MITICFFLFLSDTFSFHYEPVSLRTHTYRLAAHGTGQVKRILRLPLLGKGETVRFDACFERLLYFFCCSIVPVCRHQPLYPLVGTLEVVEVYKVSYPLTRFSHVHKDGLLEHFPP